MRAPSDRPTFEAAATTHRSGARRVLSDLAPAAFGRGALVVVAVIALACLVFPWNTSSASHYHGFDRGLVFAERGNGTSMTQSQLSMATSKGSGSVVHLITSENAFAADFDVTVMQDQRLTDWHPVTADAQSPASARYFTMKVAAFNGVALFDSVELEDLGPSGTDKPTKIFTADFTSSPPKWNLGAGTSIVDDGQGHKALRVQAPPSQEAGAWTSVVSPLAKPGDKYRVVATMRYNSESSPFVIALDWLDKDRHHISYAPDWKDWAGYSVPAVPFQLKVWYPSEYTWIDVRFLPDPTRSVVAGTKGPREYVNTKILTAYQVGRPVHLHVAAAPGQKITVAAVDESQRSVQLTESKISGIDLFKQPYLNLTFAATGPTNAPTLARVANYDLSIPAHTELSTKVSDWRLGFVLVVLFIWFVAYLAYNHGRVLLMRARSLRGAGPVGVVSFHGFSIGHAALAAAVVASLAVLGLASFVGGHPYDRLSQEAWTYVIDRYGIGAIYDRTNAVPDSLVRGGYAPWSSLGFAYMPVLAYPYWLIGKCWTWLGGSILPMHNTNFYAFWKFALSMFVVVEAGLLAYLVSTTQRIGRLKVAAIAALLLLNPAVIFDSAVWGETDAVLASALLLAMVGFLTRRPRLGWSALAISLLLKQTALLFLPIFVAFSIRRYGLRRSVYEAAFGCLVAVLATAPMILAGYGPSIAIQPAIAQFTFFAAAPPNLASADTFSLWTLFNGLHGLHGFDRILMPQGLSGPGGYSFAQLGLVVWFSLMAITLAAIARQDRGANLEQALTMGLALSVVAYVLVTPKASARYLVLALPLMLLSTARPFSFGRLAMFVTITLISTLSMYGLFMAIATRHEWTDFAVLGTPWSNKVSGAVYGVYTSDAVMTTLAIALMVVLASLARMAWAPSRGTSLNRPNGGAGTAHLWSVSPAPTHGLTHSLRNVLWATGVRGWRVARQVNWLARTEPTVWKLASFIHAAPVSGDSHIVSSDGAILFFPATYRDARTLTAHLYEPLVTELIKHTVEPNMTVVDGGAFVGYYTVLSSRLVGSTGRVYAFEPSRSAFAYLARNAAANACTNTILCPKALSDAPGQRRLFLDPAGAESFITDDQSGASEPIDTTSMDHYFESQGWPSIDLVKMDIEGGEFSALNGMAEVSRRNPGLKLILEFNPETMSRAGVNREDMNRVLRELGFQKAFVIEDGLKPVLDSQLVPARNAICNLLLVKDSADSAPE